jgi:hypothetical protein
VESWATELFAEEVVRGGPAFAVSLVLATVEPALRRYADLGSWQIISPAQDVVGTGPFADMQNPRDLYFRRLPTYARVH